MTRDEIVAKIDTKKFTGCCENPDVEIRSHTGRMYSIACKSCHHAAYVTYEQIDNSTNPESDTVYVWNRSLARMDQHTTKQLQENTQTKSPLDFQVAGDHYKRLGNYQPWIAWSYYLTEEELRGAAKFTAGVYLARNKANSDEDIEKAAHTLQLYLEVLKKKRERERK